MTAMANEVPADSMGVLPLVGEDRGNRPMWIGLGIIGLLGALLFVGLEANRRNASAVKAKHPDYSTVSVAKPQLDIPPEMVAPPLFPFSLSTPAPLALPEKAQPVPTQAPASIAPSQPKSSTSGITTPSPIVTPLAAPMVPTAPVPALPDPGKTAPVIVFDAGIVTLPNTPNAGSMSLANGLAANDSAAPIRATRHPIRPATVPQGTLIAAVLETAINSTQPGQVRALVSTNVYDTRGAQILIPRGSRLYGEYKGNLSSGQNRAFVLWSRLVRPDGVTIALDSPGSDRLGRAGIKGRVNTHFFERLSYAMLQSTIDVGAVAATQGLGSGSVIVAVPTGAQNAASQIIPQAPKPTLTVKQGTRISVFVARDLDFSGVEARQ